MTSAAAQVSIVMPTYNRARFLRDALTSITAQTAADWELIIVDDGSTDNTGDVVEQLSSGILQPVHYLRQDNQGPAAARNAGIDVAAGKYVAFYDSDDLWLPHHLARCIAGLEANPDVDWVCADLARVHSATGEVIQASKFHADVRECEFLRLSCERRGELHVIRDPRLLQSLITSGGYNSLQASVIRRSLFDKIRLRNYRVGEDRLLPIEAVLQGATLAYLDAVHVHFRMHDEHISAAAQGTPLQRQIEVYEELLRAYQALLSDIPLAGPYKRFVRERMARECFWHAGYACLWLAGKRAEAVKYFRRAIRYWPWSVALWKTYAVCQARLVLRL